MRDVPDIRFQLDEHIPNAVADALRHRGIDVLTVAEAGLIGIPDEELLAHALADGRVLVTQDGDFIGLDRRRHPHAGIACSKSGSRTIGQIVAVLVMIYEVLEPADMAGHVEFL